MKEKIGFIGVGTMGKPMALNLMKAGYELAVYDLNPQPLKEFQEKGATVGQSIREVAAKSAVVITMVPNSGDVEDVILKENGAIGGLKRGSVVIDMSTIDPGVSRKISKILRGKNIHMLDAPVSGGQAGAEAGTLAIMVGRRGGNLQPMLAHPQGHGEKGLLLRPQRQWRDRQNHQQSDGRSFQGCLSGSPGVGGEGGGSLKNSLRCH